MTARLPTHMTRRALGLGLLGAATVAFAGGKKRPTVPSPPHQGDIALIAWSPDYRVSFFGIEKLHPFDIGKYDRIAKSLVDSGLWPADAFTEPAEVSTDLLGAVHSEDYLRSLSSSAYVARALEVPMASVFPASMIDRKVLAPMRRSSQGTVLAVQHAVERGGMAINIGGGYHHARPELGHGFCVYNDVACAVHALGRSLSGPIVVFDTDAHQGDGNHAAFAGRSDVLTCSLHQQGLFPQPGVPGDMDIELAAGTDDARYLRHLDEAIDEAITRTNPGLVIHVAGADILADDPLAGLALTPSGLVERDLRVARAARATGAPIVHLLAGGYGPSAADAQAQTLAALVTEFSSPG